MTNNRPKPRITSAQVQAITAAFAEIIQQTENLVTLTPAEKRRNKSMAGSEVFCQKALTIMEQHPETVPPTVVVSESKEDLATREQLQPLLLVAATAFGRLADSHYLLGARVLDSALQGYGQMRRAARSIGLNHLVQELAPHFARQSKSKSKAKSGAEVAAAP